MVVLTGGLEKKAAEVDAIQVPLAVAKRLAVAALGIGKFLEKDLLLNHYLTAVPVDARDGVRALEWISWADELVEVSTAAGSAG